MRPINILILCVLMFMGLGSASDSSAQGQPLFSQAELDQMLAPIALYPDTVLSHVLIAATYPLEIVQAARWSRSNPELSGEEAVAAVDGMDWDPSVKALVAFPELIARMDSDLDWTQRLGDAFLTQEAAVVSTIQNLRAQAYAQGNLQSNQHVQVVRETEYIYIEPAQPRVVYVPYYDPWVVYGSWWWPAYPPVYWHHPPGFSLHLGFFWGIGYSVAPAFYFSTFHWPYHQVVVDHHHRHGHDYNRRHYRGHDSGRDLARDDGARRWRHDPDHRRGVGYRRGVDEDRLVRAAGPVVPTSLPGRTARLRDNQRDWATEKRSALAMNNFAARPRGDLVNGYGRSRQPEPDRAASRERAIPPPPASQRSSERRAAAAGLPMPRLSTRLPQPAEPAAPRRSRQSPSAPDPRSMAAASSRAQPARRAWSQPEMAPAPAPRQQRSPPTRQTERRGAWVERSAPAQRPAPSHNSEQRRSAWVERSAPVQHSAPTQNVERAQASEPAPRSRPERRAESADRQEPRVHAGRSNKERAHSRN